MCAMCGVVWCVMCAMASGICVGLEASHHVLEEGGVVYNAVLGLVDIQRGTNSYYKLQLLEGDTARSYQLFRSWGRVGTSIGGSKLEVRRLLAVVGYPHYSEGVICLFLQGYGASKAAAKAGFTTLFLEKTGNNWEHRSHGFVKQPNKFYPLEIDYSNTGEGEGEDSAVSLKGVGSQSLLHPAIQDLVRLFFDVENMKKAMMEFEVCPSCVNIAVRWCGSVCVQIDMKKMPLGKLSRRQMHSAYSVLTELQKELAGAASPARILDASNR